MILGSELRGDDFKAAAPNQEFHVQPPTNSPLVASSGLSLSKEDDKISIEWGEDRPLSADEGLAKLRDEFVSRSQKGIVKYPNSARAHTNLGIALMNQQRPDAAVEELETALRIDPQYYLAAVTLAKLKVEQNRLDEAERLYLGLQVAFPHESAPNLSLAFIAMRRFQFENAETLLSRAIELGANGVLPKYLLSMVLLRLGKNREAIKLLKAAVRSDVRSPALYQALGTAYAMAGDSSRAGINFAAALTLAPNLRSAVHSFARVLIEQGKSTHALQVLTDYLEQSPQDYVARELLGVAHAALRQYRSASHQLAQVYSVLPEDPQDAATRQRKAMIATSIGAYWSLERSDKEAEKWLLRAIDVAPNSSPLPYQNLARLHLRNDREVDAYRVLTKAKSLFPTAQDTNVLLAAVYEQEGLYDRAIRELEPLVESGKAEAQIYSGLGCQLEYAGDLLRAAKILREGLEKYPNTGSIIHNLAYVLLMSGEVAAGRETLEKHRGVLEGYAKSYPEYEPVLVATWGLVYLLEGQRDIGIRLYKRSANLASKLGNRRLAGSALQKMHAELAKQFIARDDYAGAMREVAAGLAVKRGRTPYRRELEALHNTLESR